MTIDSLNLRLLDIDIAKANLDVSKTNIWHRLIPEVRFSAGLGVQQLIFLDQTNFIPYTLPKDSYRLTLSLSLTGIIDGTSHENALIAVQRLKIRKELVLSQLDAQRLQRSQEKQLLRIQLSSLEEERLLVQSILDYKQVLFERGKIDFDEFIRMQISMLHLKRTITELRVKLSEIRQEGG